jgi:quercetin dioxygenase-like cupin family protein
VVISRHAAPAWRLCQLQFKRKLDLKSTFYLYRNMPEVDRGLIDPNNPNQAAQFAEIMSYAKIGDWKAKLIIDQFQLYAVEVTIQPGGWLGWHSHPGLSFVVVKSGTASFYEADGCTRQVIPAGGTFFELANDVHMVRNEGNVPLVNLVLQLTPPGAPRAVGEPDPGCFQLTCP